MSIDAMTGGPSQQELATLPPDVDLSSLGIFNAVLQGFGPASTAVENQVAIQAAVNQGELYGGDVWLPNIGGGVNQISGEIDPGSEPLKIYGTHGTILQKVDTGRLFAFNGNCNGGSPDGRGSLVAYLKIKYANGSTGAALVSNNSQGLKGYRLFFGNCIAFISDSNSNFCGIDDCTIQNDTVSNITLVSLAGTQTYCMNGEFRQKPINTGGPTGNTGVLFNGANYARLKNLHVSDFDYGVKATDGTLGCWMDEVNSQSHTTALTVQPSASNKNINGLISRDCLFSLSNGSSNTTPVVFVDTNGGPNTNVEEIFLGGCRIYGGLGYGVQIGAGIVDISGGSIRGNVTAGVGVTGGGIARLVGVKVLGNVPGGSATQLLAFYVGASGQLFAKSCPVEGNVTSVVGVSSPTTVDLQECNGYNNIYPTFSAVPANGVAFGPKFWGYYGPMQYSVGGGSVSSILNGAGTSPLTSGAFRLMPTQQDTINYSVAPTILAVGQ